MSPLGLTGQHRLPPITLDDIREEKGTGFIGFHDRRPITADSRPGRPLEVPSASAHGRRPLSIVSQITALRSTKNILKGITGHAPPTYRKNYVQSQLTEWK